jgi:GNAT superfamily N-acetyltransferase
MDLASPAISALILAAGLGLVVFVFYCLLRWARSGGSRAHVLGAVLTEVTQSAVVLEAKQGKKRNDDGAGDPKGSEEEAHDVPRRTLAPASPMLIRRLERNDLRELLALYRHLHSKDEPLPEPAVVESVWTEAMASPNYRYYGGFVDAQLVSSCALSIVPNLTRGCRPYGLIENVVTHASHRRRGYASQLLREALRDAWAGNCYKVMLLTGRNDESTFRFYESAGFDRNAKQAFVAKPDG